MLRKNAIINHGGGSSQGYYDIEMETFVGFDEVGLASTTVEAVSGNNILLKRFNSQGGEWLIHNTLTKQHIVTQIEPSTFPDPYPDNQGGFYFDGWSFDDNPSLFFINEIGQYSEIEQDFDYIAFYSGDRMDGEIKSLAFDGEEDLIIFSTDGVNNEIVRNTRWR